MLRVGIVGVNGIGQAHAWALKSLDTSELTAVCDIETAHAEKTARDFEVNTFTDLASMCASDLVDAVVVATPAGTHVEIARAALDAGLHVYCEKPVATTSDDGYTLASYAREKARVLQIGFQFRYHRGYTALREAYAQLGELRRVNVVATNWFRPQAYFVESPWRASWRMAGGGVLMNQAVHQVDALINTVGMPSRVTARVRTAAHQAAIEDEAIALLEWPNGACGTLVASLNDIAGSERIELFCDGGAVTLVDGYDVQVTQFDVRREIDENPDAFATYETAWESLVEPGKGSDEFKMFLAAHREFATTIAEGRAPAIDGVSGTRSVELANAIYLSSLENTSVQLPLASGSYAPVFEELASGRRLLNL